MRLVDTSAFVEWIAGSATGARLAELLPPIEAWLVPTMVQLELCKWATRELGEDRADQIIAFTETCVVAPLNTRIALAAAGLCRSHKLATADAIVYATAMDHGAELITCDADFRDLPAVTWVEKS